MKLAVYASFIEHAMHSAGFVRQEQTCVLTRRAGYEATVRRKFSTLIWCGARETAARRQALRNSLDRRSMSRNSATRGSGSPSTTTWTESPVPHLGAARLSGRRPSTIRVGSGGVMLPNHAPLVIAEQFGTLEKPVSGAYSISVWVASPVPIR